MPETPSTGLPDVRLAPGTTITVDAGPGNVVTQLVIHAFQVTPGAVFGTVPAAPILVPRTDAA